jgi:hypothetical protein
MIMQHTKIGKSLLNELALLFIGKISPTSE